ncbi:hypothetical protein J2741_002520 [Methanolinea mesophila]|nr:hypothetical protein [Methanolinea mesophila]MBP1929924.1 hypothetical protein [Methanolinea mesophila]
MKLPGWLLTILGEKTPSRKEVPLHKSEKEIEEEEEEDEIEELVALDII